MNGASPTIAMVRTAVVKSVSPRGRRPGFVFVVHRVKRRQVRVTVRGGNFGGRQPNVQDAVWIADIRIRASYGSSHGGPYAVYGWFDGECSPPALQRATAQTRKG